MVSHFFETHGGGIERVAGQLCRQCIVLGASTAWAASDADDPPDFLAEPVPLSCIDPIESLTGLPMPIPRPRAVRRLVKQIRSSDAVLIHDALYITSILTLLIAKAMGKRTILIQHIAAIPFSSRILRGLIGVANTFVTRPMLWAADKRVFISSIVRTELLGEGADQSSDLLFNGVDHSVFGPAHFRAGEPAAVAGITAARGQRRLLFVGRYVDKKGLKVLRALAELRPELNLFLVGKGPIRPGEWNLANVHDLGSQTQESLADLYRWADLLILPSVGEGYPLVIQEAMACGLPVVCGAPADRADPDAARWLRGVSIDLTRAMESAERCAAAIDMLNLSADDRAEMSRYALERYDWHLMAKRLLALAQPSTSTSMQPSDSAHDSGREVPADRA